MYFKTATEHQSENNETSRRLERGLNVEGTEEAEQPINGEAPLPAGLNDAKIMYRSIGLPVGRPARLGYQAGHVKYK